LNKKLAVNIHVCTEIGAYRDTGEFSSRSLLRTVKEEPGRSVRRIAAAEGIGFPLVWRILREESLYQCHTQQVQDLTPAQHHARVVFLLMGSLKVRFKRTVCS
jgi:hypothetical protein